MHDLNQVTAADFSAAKVLFPFVSPADIPISFSLGNQKIVGIPPSFNPQTARRRIDSNILEISVQGELDGLTVTAVCTEYADFPVREWAMTFFNAGECDTPVLSDILSCDGLLPGENPVLTYSNGDNREEDGFEFFTEPVEKEISLSPIAGLPCKGASPYMRIRFKDYGANIAIGWPGTWRAKFSPDISGAHIAVGQAKTNFCLHPGETAIAPKITFMAFTGDENRARNLWRRWYFAHIIPKENGRVLPPKFCCHDTPPGYACFEGSSETQQLNAIDEIIGRGVRPDVWWIDAGWFPCGDNWGNVGTLSGDPERYPNGLAPIGKKCAENGMQFILWFEPERTRPSGEIYKTHPEWMLDAPDNPGAVRKQDYLVDLGNEDCFQYMLNTLSGRIKEYGVNIYRQDLNTGTDSYWDHADRPGREGYTENRHVRNYLRLWDGLLERCPGLLIDSCAGGGTRNELEAMRRSVPFHYSDVGHGHHLVKQKQVRYMFEWIPYFYSTLTSLDLPDGSYLPHRKVPYPGSPPAVDEFSYYNALAPAISNPWPPTCSEEKHELALKMLPVWRAAAELELSGDYYPLSECRKDPHDWYACQFDNPVSGEGFILFIRNTQSPDETFTVYPCADETLTYSFENRVTGETLTLSGSELIKNGFTASLPKRSGAVWFYKAK